MTRPMGLLQWSQTVSTSLPHLSQPHRTGLVLWSCGIVLAQSCGLTTVATFLAYLLGKGEATVREQLRDWYRDGQHKRGAKRGDKRYSLEVVTCVAPWLRWASRGPTRPAAASLWQWMPRPWDRVLLCFSSALSSVDVPSRWPGGLWRPPVLGPGARIGKRSLGICRAVCPPTGRSLSWPIGAFTPMGSSPPCRRWAGLPSCGSIGTGPIVRRPALPFAP